MPDTKKYYYMRLNENYFDSDEQAVLESMPDGYLYSNILLKLYLKSLKRDGLLMFNDRIPYNAQMIASVTRHQVGTVEKALKVFSDMGIIEVLDNGAIYMSDVQNFVGKTTNEAERIRAYRARIEASKSGFTIPEQTEVCTESVQMYTDERTNSVQMYTRDRVKTKDRVKNRDRARGVDTDADASAPSPSALYGQYKNVKLTDDEIDKLKAEFPTDWQSRIERLSEYIAQTGKKYKSHLATIRAWARRDATEQTATAKHNPALDYIQREYNDDDFRDDRFIELAREYRKGAT